MDRKPLPVGIDDFGKLVERGYYFIDKTNFIRDLIDLKEIGRASCRERV